ncbi:hypothetical protein [Bradyrhizobium sp. McL0616]|uniref:hypothetical protein n=1 Tax=Bradyrhizobium sp. McL0616 TaxID=3415674 RepID=UPI003CF0C85F
MATIGLIQVIELIQIKRRARRFWRCSGQDQQLSANPVAGLDLRPPALVSDAVSSFAESEAVSLPLAKAEP